jgi:hypothetical protein
MTRRRKPSAPPLERTLQDELKSVAIAPRLKRTKNTLAAIAREVEGARERIDALEARDREDPEARAARQITELAAEVAELLLAPAPE